MNNQNTSRVEDFTRRGWAEAARQVGRHPATLATLGTAATLALLKKKGIKPASFVKKFGTNKKAKSATVQAAKINQKTRIKEAKLKHKAETKNRAFLNPEVRKTRIQSASKVAMVAGGGAAASEMSKNERLAREQEAYKRYKATRNIFGVGDAVR